MYRFKTVFWVITLLLLSGTAGCAGKRAEQQKNQVSADSAESSTADGEQEESYILFPEFSTITLDGEEIDNTVFADAEITMVNIWGTFCGPCINEMPDLEKLYQELPEGCALLGLLTDVYGDQNLDAANQIVEKTGVTYVNIIPDETLYQFLSDNITGVPTTLYVDSEGNILGGVVGARSMEKYLEILQTLVKKE